jgi:pyruvate dehydrogenase E1 component alpha subunit
MPGVRVDGNDVLASLAVVRAALDRAREGGGPTFIEAVTYRMGAHTTSDDPTRYRPAGELEEWAERDPLDRLRRHLLAEGLADEEWFAELDAEADDLGARMRSGIRGMTDPHPLAMFEHAYAEAHGTVEAHRAECAADLGTTS